MRRCTCQAFWSQRGTSRSQALELVHQLKGDVAAAEYYAIVASFLDANQQAGLEDLVEEGLDVADDAVSEVTLLRQLGRILFRQSDVAGRRARYAEALKVFEKYPGHGPSYIAFNKATTRASWARSERSFGDCDEAWRQVTPGAGA
jgi:hypothetical protein